VLRRALIAVALAALAVGGLAAASGFRGDAKAPIAVRVLAKDFSFSLSRTTVPIGKVRFTVVNVGDVAHDFAIAGRKTRTLKPRQTAALDVIFAKAGRFTYRCAIPGHVALGMSGWLTVGAAKPATTRASTTSTPAPASSDPELKLEKVGDFERPVQVTAPRADSSHIFVVEQRGTIQEIVDGKVLPQPFLDIRDRVLEVNERGLLSMAFAPDYARTGRFYVDYTDKTGNGNVNVVEYLRSEDGDSADPGSARQVLTIVKPWENHNAGMLLFGNGGNLFVGVGDGDSGVLHPPGAFAQTLDDLLGNILRIDPRHPTEDAGYSVPEGNPFDGREGARAEIWDYGLRNPWRFWIDPVTSDLYVADAGEGDAEEIDYVEGNVAGQNFGWPCFEGTLAFDTKQSCPGAVAPIFEYDHSGGRCAVVGGVVVHDPRLVGLEGRYLYGDYCDGKIHALLVEDGKVTENRDLGLTVPTLSSFGLDGRGGVYVVATDGGVYRLKAA
jgi:glucose/arabinose dehydrogenase